MADERRETMEPESCQGLEDLRCIIWNYNFSMSHTTPGISKRDNVLKSHVGSNYGASIRRLSPPHTR